MKPCDAAGSVLTDGLLDAAIALLTALSGAAGAVEARVRLDAFEAAYRRWLTEHASFAGSGAERMEKLRLVLMAAAAAPHLGGALETIIRFGRLTAPELSPSHLTIEDDVAILRFNRVRRAGAAGLIGELWPLALLLSQAECLAGRSLGLVEGTVRHPAILSEGAIALLFDRPVLFEQPELALHIPARYLNEPVVAQYDELSTFLPRRLPDAFGEGGRMREEFPSLLKGILRLDRLGGMQMSTLESVAERLGCSPATLRRRLAEEGSGFLQLRDAVNNDLARRWLIAGRLGVATVAERLGYSDAYSFARFFARINGCTPAAYRRRHLPHHAHERLSGNVVSANGSAIVESGEDSDKVAQTRAARGREAGVVSREIDIGERAK